MGARFRTVHEWLADCRSTVRRDLDNLILFTGAEGSGKSTVAVQVMRALDGSFGVERIHFGIRAFLGGAPGTPQFGAVLGDEMLVNKRKAMYGDTLELLDFLQICRGLNLHMGICFPHESLLDTAILNTRVRWKVHVAKRGSMVVSERRSRTFRAKGGVERTVHVWVERGRWRFGENTGPMWEAYLAKKAAHMRGRGVDLVAQPKAPEAVEVDLGLDVIALRDHLGRILAASRVKDPERATAGASIKDQP
jgi:hypothetical protein